MNKDWVDHLNTSILLSTSAIKEAREAMEETRPEILGPKLVLVGEYLLQAHTQVMNACKKVANNA